MNNDYLLHIIMFYFYFNLTGINLTHHYSVGSRLYLRIRDIVKFPEEKVLLLLLVVLLLLLLLLLFLTMCVKALKKKRR